MEIIRIDVEDENYPQRLLKIKNFPTEIYAVGNIGLLNAKYTIGVVGSRKCTEYGRRVANEFARTLSKKEICIISGMAVGIDGIVHNAAIEEEGKTIAVLGGGFNYIYPPENEWLFHKILERGGCIISEYSPDVEPDNKKFPIRNRIISGLSDAVLVVEAIHRSGSTITAKYAKAEGKTVFAIPNNIYVSTGVGTNRLIQEGAILVTSPMDIINIFREKMQKTKKRTSNKTANLMCEEKDHNKINDRVMEEEQIKISKEIKEKIIGKIQEETTEKNEEKKPEKTIMPKDHLEIYRVLSDEPMHINEIANKLNKQVQEISPNITMMELEDIVYQPQTNYFIRKNEINFEIN